MKHNQGVTGIRTNHRRPGTDNVSWLYWETESGDTRSRPHRARAQLMEKEGVCSVICQFVFNNRVILLKLYELIIVLLYILF